MKNESVGQKGQELAEKYFKNRGYEVVRTYEMDNSLPYDLHVRSASSKRWKKIQVKATATNSNGRKIFRTRKTRGTKKISYEKKDLDSFVLVDVREKTFVIAPFSTKGCHSFSQDRWKECCVSLKAR